MYVYVYVCMSLLKTLTVSRCIPMQVEMTYVCSMWRRGTNWCWNKSSSLWPPWLTLLKTSSQSTMTGTCWGRREGGGGVEREGGGGKERGREKGMERERGVEREREKERDGKKERERERLIDCFIKRMTVLGRGLVFQLVLVTQTCTYNSNNIALQNIGITD